uniref:NADH-ubiquinone oxidoreductase chain 4 n=1 Tax=Phyllocoptes taishanensis TaxID=1638174 RepID=A0A0U2PVN6_9ACAR|nr:NADH dehydrogenase subunit 4 [Phyllocoptes taishanensis]ALK03803.1 NADH dehydrogenase subunit 4 [Phyllocoptes taishanensis]
MIWSWLALSLLFCSCKSYSFFSGFMVSDSYSLFMLSICPLTFFLLCSFEFVSVGDREDLDFKFLFFLLMVLVGGAFLAVNPFLFLVALELTVTPMCILILVYSKDYDKLLSVFFMLFINLLGSIPFMMFCLLYNKAGYQWVLGSGWLSSFCYHEFVVWLGFVVILISKLPFIFFHFWLTKAHVSASGACSMILASLMLKLGSFGLFKFSSLFKIPSFKVMSGVLGLAVLSVLVFCVIMIRFFDMKYVIACSSIVHMSLVFPLVLTFQTVAVAGSVLMMVGHGLISYILFFIVSYIYEFSHSRSLDFNKSLESTIKSISFLVFLFMFLNLGLPPFLSFFSELYYCTFMIGFSLVSLILFSFSMIISIIFLMIMVSKVLFGKKIIKAAQPNFEGVYFYSLSFLSFIVWIPFFL